MKLEIIFLCLSSSLLFSCETAPRFAPLVIETSKPARTLPAEQWPASQTITGDLPQVQPPTLQCLKVGPDGKTTLPPLASGSDLGTYQDALVCYVALSSEKNYDQVRLQLRAGSEVSALFEAPFPVEKTKREQLFWIHGTLWRELLTEKKFFSIEAIFPCQEEEEGMGCEFVLSQPFSAVYVAPEARTEPKTIKGTGAKLSDLRCASSAANGFWGSAFTPESLLTEHFFCEVTIENPNETKLENVLVELKGGVTKNTSKVLTSRRFSLLEPKAKLSYLFFASTSITQTGNYVLVMTAGRNATERNATQQSISLKTKAIAASLPTTEPAGFDD